MRRGIMTLLAAATAACGDVDAPTQPAVTNAAETAQSYQQRILALPDPQRRAVFLNAIRDAGLDCQHVRSADGAGTYRGMPVWRATCRGGGVWTIVIADGGIAQVLNANEARLITDNMSNGAR